MNPLSLSLAYLRAQKLASLLTLLLLSVGIAMLSLLLLLGDQLQSRLARDAAGWDLVIGAKGSPLQLVLSAVYQLDAPTGNIPLAQAQVWREHPQVAEAVPLALGDSYRGYRIVGTEVAYARHYAARPAQGRWWQAPMEAVLGAEVARRTALSVGATLVGAHGLSGGSEHDHWPYRVVGVLAPTGSVIDRLVLTDVASVWQLHAALAGQEDDNDHAHHDEPYEVQTAPREVTALLLRYRTPRAALTLPRMVNAQSALQAAAPAVEVTRLFRLLGVGFDVLRGFAFLLLLMAMLGLFAALSQMLETRRYDLALLRLLGASPIWLFGQVCLQAALLTLGGLLLGLLLGHGAAEWLGQQQRPGELALTGLTWTPQEAWLPPLALLTGLVAALLPAWRAYRTDIAPALARG